MIERRDLQSHCKANLGVALPILLLLGSGIGVAYGQQPAKPENPPATDKAAGQEFALRASARRERSSIPIGARFVSRFLEQTWCAGHQSPAHLRQANPPSALT
jgi:hypothetical protein